MFEIPVKKASTKRARYNLKNPRGKKRGGRKSKIRGLNSLTPADQNYYKDR